MIRPNRAAFTLRFFASRSGSHSVSRPSAISAAMITYAEPHLIVGRAGNIAQRAQRQQAQQEQCRGKGIAAERIDDIGDLHDLAVFHKAFQAVEQSAYLRKFPAMSFARHRCLWSVPGPRPWPRRLKRTIAGGARHPAQYSARNSAKPRGRRSGMQARLVQPS